MWMSLAPFLIALSRMTLHEPHDRRVLARLLELEDVDLFRVGAEVDVFVAQVEAGHHLVVGGARVVVALDRRCDRGLAGDDRLDVVAGQELDVVDGVQVRRVGHRDDQRRARARDRNDPVLVADLAGDELDHFRIDLVLVEIDRGHAVLRRKEIRDLAVGDVAELRERVAEVLARALLLVLRFPELLQADELLANEELTEAILGHGETKTAPPENVWRSQAGA